MLPPTQLNAEALSGIFGSISVTCWFVVFIPQIVENFRNRSTEGLSLKFIVIWTLGDVFNIIGGIAQQVLPTMLILASYFVAVDVVLLGQFFYYGDSSTKSADDAESPTTPALLSSQSYLSSGGEANAANLSPATPFVDTSKDNSNLVKEPKSPAKSWLVALLQALLIPLICMVGIFAWWVSNVDHGSIRSGRRTIAEQEADLRMDITGQIFGYLCALTYLGSRLPQILLNYQRKSTEGLVAIFFFFAWFGNLTYVFSILVYEPRCRHPHHCLPEEVSNYYWRRMGVIASWLLGSVGTLFLDGIILFQFFKYRGNGKLDNSPAEQEDERRPLLDRESINE